MKKLLYCVALLAAGALIPPIFFELYRWWVHIGIDDGLAGFLATMLGALALCVFPLVTFKNYLDGSE